MHPDEHRQHHKDNGDFRRWGGMRGKKGPVVKGLGWLGIIPNIAGLLSGRIRTDTPDNMLSDLFGVPSEEDRRKAYEKEQRMINPKWKPGDPMGV